MNMLKVLNITTGKVAASGATRYSVEVRQLDTGVVHRASYFAEGELCFGVGDEISGNIEVKGQYTNLRNVTPIRDVGDVFEGTKPVETPKNANLGGSGKVPQKVWDDKDSRMVKMNCLSHATKICLETEREKNLTCSEMTNLVEIEAMQLYDWVYEGKKEEVEAPF